MRASRAALIGVASQPLLTRLIDFAGGLIFGFADAFQALGFHCHRRLDFRIAFDQRLERALGVGDDADIDGKNFADLPGIFFDVDDFCRRFDDRFGDVAIFADQAATDGDDHVGLAPDRQIERRLPFGDLKTLWMGGRKGQKRIARFHDHRRRDHLGKFN